jgi:UDP-N-acetylmuramoyl-L-alanyl-D-glutamate--2,6-diaminopimelate ligase
MATPIRPQIVATALADVLPDGVSAGEGAIVTGVSLDSRSVLPGDLYAALPGHLTHGARFADQAVAAGASAILTDPVGAPACRATGVPVVVMDDPRAILGFIAARIYREPAGSLHVIGVTGTNGKTTVASMVEQGLRAGGRTTGLLGTVGVRVGDTAYPGVRTTPEATDLHALLGVMRDARVDTVVMEVSSIAVEEHRVDGLTFDVTAFTQLTQDHLDYHGTMEAYFAAKAQLFTRERSALGIVGIDDEWGWRLASQATTRVQTWSLVDQRADWHVLRDQGRVWVVGPDGSRQDLDVPLPGAFNVANAVCAFAVLRASGIEPQDAAAGIAAVRVPGRMQVVSDAGGIRGIVDYAHSPDAIQRVIRAVRDETSGRVIVVVGAGGDRDRGKRPLMGRIAARLADLVVITDDNPRTEDPTAIRSAIREGVDQVAPDDRAEVLDEGDRAAAITVAVEAARAGDVVLVLGKGHEQGQEVAGIVTPFDDATVLRAALEARSHS